MSGNTQGQCGDGLRFVDESGVTRSMGNVPAPAGLTRAWPIYGTTPEAPMVPESEWKDRIDAMGGPGHETDYLPPVHDQNGYGMCNCSATAGAIESQRAKQGLKYRKLSAGDLYNRICGGRDQGSTLEDGLAEAMRAGLATINSVPYLDWRTNHSGEAQVQSERKQNRVLKAFLCPSPAHCMSATFEGFDLISGVLWFQNYNPDQDGWLPLRPSRNVGGHAIHGYKPTYSTKFGGGVQYGVWHQQSWGNWGPFGGPFVLPLSAYGQSIGGWWAVRLVVDEGGVVPPASA